MDKSIIGSQLEKVLLHIKDIHTVKVNLAPDGDLEGIHVLASSDRSIKQIVRDIQTALLSQFGLRISSDRLRVTLIGGELDPDAAWGRPVLTGVQVYAAGSLSRVVVELKKFGLSFRGEAEGPAFGLSHLRMVSEATLRAAEGYLQTGLEFQVEDVVLLPLTRAQVAVAAVSYIDPVGKIHTLTGSATLRHDDREAVARATLDALNRQFMVKIAFPKKRTKR